MLIQFPPQTRRRSAIDKLSPGLLFGHWTRTRQFRVASELWAYLHAHRHTYDVVYAHNIYAMPALVAAVAIDAPLVSSPLPQ